MAQPTPSEPQAHRALLTIAARAMGIATETDLRDYFRMPVAETKARLAEMVEDGALDSRFGVQGWRNDAYLAPGAKAPRKSAASALLSPFDNLIWFRERTERMFDVRIRLEIYTPAAKRAHGYYVLPFLLGDAIAAKGRPPEVRPRDSSRLLGLASRPSGTRRGPGSPWRPRLIAAELRTMAGWLGLDEVPPSSPGATSRPRWR